MSNLQLLMEGSLHSRQYCVVEILDHVVYDGDVCMWMYISVLYVTDFILALPS
jgi:hypothetical protein